jgi:hypothetical protein
MKQTPQNCLAPSAIEGPIEKTAIYESGNTSSPDMESAGSFILVFHCGTVEINHPVCDNFIMATPIDQDTTSQAQKILFFLKREIHHKKYPGPNLNNLKRTKTVHGIFSNHNRKKLEITDRKTRTFINV